MTSLRLNLFCAKAEKRWKSHKIEKEMRIQSPMASLGHNEDKLIGRELKPVTAVGGAYTTHRNIEMS